MANRYLSQIGAGAGDGTLGNAWSAATFNSTATYGAGDTIFGIGSITTKLTLRFSGSGTTAATRITLKGDGLPGGAYTTILTGIDSGAKNNIAVFGFQFTTTVSSNYSCILLGGCTGWLIQDNYFFNTYADAITSTNGTANSKNIIRHNSFKDVTLASLGAAGGGVNISVEGDKNLIEYNSVLGGLDRTTFFGTGNVIRNNYWGATDTAPYSSSVPFPYHTDTTQTYEGRRVPGQLLYEKNYSADNTDSIGTLGSFTNAHWLNIQNGSAGGSANFDWFIFRQNIDLRTGGTHMDFIATNRVYEYNDTIVGSLSGDPTTTNTPCFWHGTPTSDVAWIGNNAWAYNPKCLDTPGGIYGTSYRPTNFTSGANFSFNTGGGTQPVLPLSASPANLSHVDPLFTDGTGVAGHDNYTPTLTSPLKAAAGPITTANGAGADSTSLTVVNADRLFDGLDASGWAAADADFITIGNQAEVQISSINYSTKVVTLAATRTWNNGDNVFVRGTKDVGALPYGAAVAPVISSGVVTSLAGTATATVADAFNVRFCEMEVDGIPVATSFTPSGSVFSLSWTGDGSNAHTFLVRAYSQWTSATPTVEQTISFSPPAGSGGLTTSGSLTISGKVKLQ